MKTTYTKAKNLKRGDVFRKKHGEYAYIVIAEASLKYHFGEAHQDRTLGVCYNGSITELQPETVVKQVSLEEMAGNQRKTNEWHRAIGCSR